MSNRRWGVKVAAYFQSIHHVEDTVNPDEKGSHLPDLKDSSLESVRTYDKP